MKRFFSLCLATIVAAIAANELAQALESQVLSPNAYKVPYLGFDGVFNLNTEQEQSVNDSRNPKRIVIEKMEKFSFYRDTALKMPIARNCHYTYMGAAPDPKFYSESKSAVWDLFELVDEKQDAACNQFKYLVATAPHDEPLHMHFRYGNEQSSLDGLLNMSNAPENAAKFSPWFATYCGGGKTQCGK